MHEELLQFVWNKGLFNATRLRTVDDLPVTVESRGTWNEISGPDFAEARIRIGETLWVGSVEIHLRSSDWIRHNHQSDKAYDNVVLHVVYEHDAPVENSRGEIIPTLELCGRIPGHIIGRYEKLRAAGEEIPCNRLFGQVPRIYFTSWLDRLLVARLERKSGDIALVHRHDGNDWLQTFYILFAGYLGQNRNKLPFQELARVLPITLLLKYQDQPRQVEALLFGAAGLLPTESHDEYTGTLIREYRFLKTKHRLHEITQQWRFGGIRPMAFPTVRIALLAALVPYLPVVQSRLVTTGDHRLSALRLDIHPFWEAHFTFTQVSPAAALPHLSAGLIQVLTINVIAPYLFFYARSVDDERLAAMAIELLHNTPPEQNAISRTWEKTGYQACNASDSQALIELTTQYCNVKKCVLCNVGRQLISLP